MLQRWGKVRTLSRYLHHRPTSDHGCRYFVCLGAFVRCLRYCVADVPALALPPPTGTVAVPSGPSGVLHTCGAGSLFGSSTRRLEARPGPAATHRHRGRSLRSLRRPPHRRRLRCCVVSARPRSPRVPQSGINPPWPRHRPRAPQPGPPVPSNPSNRSALGRESPKTQTTSVKMGEFGVFWARWSAFWAHSGYE